MAMAMAMDTDTDTDTDMGTDMVTIWNCIMRMMRRSRPLQSLTRDLWITKRSSSGLGSYCMSMGSQYVRFNCRAFGSRLAPGVAPAGLDIGHPVRIDLTSIVVKRLTLWFGWQIG